MRRTVLIPLIGLAAGLFAVVPQRPASAATGLDPDYGEAGVATMLVDEGTGELEPMISFFGDADESGRVVRGSLGTDQVVRLDADGELDATFGGGDGIADVEADLGVIDATDDGIVVGGHTVADGASMLDADGTVDEGWGVDGHAALAAPGVPGDATVTDVDLAPDGSVYAMASGGAGGAVWVIRVLPDGTVDEDFGDGGSVLRDEPDLEAPTFEGLDATGSGVVFVRNVVVGEDPEAYEAIVEHLLVSGEPHDEFGVDGQVRVQGGALALDIDERDHSIFLGGADADGAAVWHLEWNGALDRRFAAGSGSPPGRLVWDLEALGDGHVAAATEGSGDTATAFVLRPDGELAAGFGPAGQQPAPGAPTIGGGLGVGRDGRVLLYTRTGDGVETARAFLTELGGLTPTITAVTPYATSLSVEWTGPEAADLPPVRVWQVMAFDVDAKLLGQSVVAGDVRQASIEGLDPRHEHHAVVVRPYDDFGPAMSSHMYAAPLDAAAPAAGPAPAVRDVVASPGQGFATVSWTPPASDGGTTIWGYAVVTLKHADGSFVSWRNVRADVRSAAVPNLDVGTAYDVHVFAVTSLGFGAVAGPVAVTPTAAPPASSTPQMGWVSVVPVGPHAVVTWGPPTERGQVTTVVDVIVIEDGAMTVYRRMTSFDRQVVVPARPGAQVYAVASSAGGYGPLTGPITVG